MTPLERILERLDGVRRTTLGSITARCPPHDDRRSSPSVEEAKDGRVLLLCHAGCTVEDIVAALRLTMRDLFANGGRGREGRRIVATYDYRDERGALLFQAVRFEPKDFSQRRPLRPDDDL